MKEKFTINSLVIPERVTFPEGSLTLESNLTFDSLTVQYEKYGDLNKDKTNGILIVHAFSGDAHAAGSQGSENQNPGWWFGMIGPGLAFDTDHFCVICSNCLGGCMGTTGPSSINPATSVPYGMDFPVITIQDIVNVQKMLMEHLGIPRWAGIAGGSMGGMQVLDWAIRYPDKVEKAIILASTGRLSAQGLAFNAVGRNAIYSDPNWNNGNYYSGEPPRKGLAIARMIGHITYLSDESMAKKFGRRLQTRDSYGYDLEDQFQVESYLNYQGDKFVDRFDANSYIFLSKAMDYFDLESYSGGITGALSRIEANVLVLSYTSDWLFPTYQSKELVYGLMKAGKNVSFAELESPYGHDSFLLETERQGILISSFLQASNTRNTFGESK